VKSAHEEVGNTDNPFASRGNSMMRIAWMTDLHLNFVDRSSIKTFCQQILAASPDVVLLAGDIGEAPSVVGYLKDVEESLQMPLYFVLGNHDFYHGSIAAVRREVAQLSARSRFLRWLSNAGVVRLSSETGLIGHDSWADGRFGNGPRSNMMLNDYLLIGDFIGLSVTERFRKLALLGDQAAAYFAKTLPVAFEKFQSVILLTHVPPFRESCWHEGQISDDDALPHFACKSVGDVLRKIMIERPDRNLTVLCGHTHSGGSVLIEPNLRVIAGSSLYGAPQLQDILMIP
jgi:Icc-related predicted phosphoesterase